MRSATKLVMSLPYSPDTPLARTRYSSKPGSAPKGLKEGPKKPCSFISGRSGKGNASCQCGENTSFCFIFLFLSSDLSCPGHMPLRGGGVVSEVKSTGVHRRQNEGGTLPHRAEELRSQKGLSRHRPFSVQLPPHVAQMQAQSWEVHGRVGQPEPQISFQRTNKGSPKCPEIRQWSQGSDHICSLNS